MRKRYAWSIVLLTLCGAVNVQAKEKEKSLPASARMSLKEMRASAACYERWADVQPPLDLLVEKAYVRFRLSFKDMTTLERKSKRAALLPKLTASYDVDFDEKSAIAIEDTVAVSNGDITVGPPESQENYNIGQGQSLGVKLGWDLAPLVYHRDHVLMHREQLAVAESRLKFSEKLAELYRKRDMVAAKRCMSATPLEEMAATAELRGLEQGLESLSGYRFEGTWNAHWE